MFEDFYYLPIFILPYDDDDSEDEGDGEGASNDNQDDGDNKQDKEKSKENKTFTQDEVNRMLADDRRKSQRNREQLIDQLTKLRESTKLSDEQKDELQTRIEQLQNETLTVQEMSKKDREKLVKEHQKITDKLTKDATFWREQYSNEKISRELLDAAIENDSVSPNQIMNMLRPDTKLVEEIINGTPTGKWVPRVRIQDKDENGNPLILELSPSDAIKRMSDLPENWNLFNAGVKSGLGNFSRSNGSTLRGSKPPSDPKAYKKWREENLRSAR